MLFKEIICLANSYKLQNRCIAGKEISTLKWVRPVSSRETGELDLGQVRLAEGGIPKLLDVIRFPILNPRPNYFQPENILVQDGYLWSRSGSFPETKIRDLLDKPPVLWQNCGGKNDCVSSDLIQKDPVSASLYFINPESFRIHNVERSTGSIQTRAIFSYSGIDYDLVVTDPEAKDEFLKRGKGDYVLDEDIFLCISLGEPFQGFHYKLIASIIRKKRQHQSDPVLCEKKYSIEKIRQDHPNAYQKWSQDEDILLKKEFQSGKSTETLAEFFRRKIGAIRSRLKKLGLRD